MTLNGWLQISLVLAIVLALVGPLGAHMARSLQGKRNFLSPVLGPVERGIYRVSGIDPAGEHGWLGYAASMLAFNAAGEPRPPVVIDDGLAFPDGIGIWVPAP